MSLIKKMWLGVSNQGIAKNTNDRDVQMLRLTNQFVTLALVFTGIYVFIFFSLKTRHAFYVELVLFGLFFLLFLNNRAGRIPLSKTIFILIINLQMFCLCLCFGQRSQMHLIYVPVAAVPLILYGIQNIWRILFFSAYTVILFITLFAIRFSSFMLEDVSDATYQYLEVYSVVTSIICELVVIYSFMSVSDNTEKRLDENNSFLQSQLQAIFDNSLDALFLVDALTNKITKVNKRAIEIFEMDSEADFYSLSSGLELHKQEMPADEVEKMVRGLKSSGIYETEILYKTRSGKAFWGALSSRLINIQDKAYQSVRVTYIHSQKTLQETTEAALHEKEVLLAEIHHRVKNNMAVISSLLSLQSGYVEDEKAKQMFQESRNRIHSMALIHEKLYKHDSFSKIEFGIYIHDLIGHIERSHNLIQTRIRFSVLCTDVFLDIKNAVPCGLILNELVTNACKHAFIGKAEGKIRIECIKTDAQILLRVSDNGTGFNAREKVANSKTLGLTLINGLVEQLGGTLSIATEEGTSYSILFEA